MRESKYSKSDNSDNDKLEHLVLGPCTCVLELTRKDLGAYLSHDREIYRICDFYVWEDTRLRRLSLMRQDKRSFALGTPRVSDWSVLFRTAAKCFVYYHVCSFKSVIGCYIFPETRSVVFLTEDPTQRDDTLIVYHSIRRGTNNIPRARLVDYVRGQKQVFSQLSKGYVEVWAV